MPMVLLNAQYFYHLRSATPNPSLDHYIPHAFQPLAFFFGGGSVVCSPISFLAMHGYLRNVKLKWFPILPPTACLHPYLEAEYTRLYRTQLHYREHGILVS
uniref:Uncharacterized protein n=1 Tax=Picea glauca TaxID=3330 RepID=A0A124GNA6_PICGL|nr:hypothetical protein ABT39_MTgene5200 [Picea glauca]QHR91179.1 hypothetical protein Q903MT_gene5211 [Picea sitchensis]